MVEDLARNQQEPFSFETTSIVAGLIYKGYLNFALEFPQASAHELIVRALEEMGPIDFDMNSSAALPPEFGMIPKDKLFGLKV